MKKTIFTIATMLCFGIMAHANNIKIQNVSVVGTNVTFDISWENSWNSTTNIDPNYPNNWDAAWVFVKVQSNLDNLWMHQNVSTSTGHSITGGVLQVDPVTDGVGVFIRRSAAGNGNVSATATISMQTLPAGTLNFRVFGIEMVQIPQGNFFVNDGATGSNRFNSFNVTSSSIGSSALYSGNPPLGATYPTGFQAIYAAKYETSMAQMVDYLNTLTYDQQANITDQVPNAIQGSKAFSGGYANLIIEIDTPGVNNTKPAVFGCDGNGNNSFNDPDDGQNVACGVFTTRRTVSFLDWCGLRPMTELEYEKICRGTMFNGTPNPRVANEYPWGTIGITPYSRPSISFLYTDSARFNGAVVNGRAMLASNGVASHGPVRVGVFAELATGRAAAGAGFYGNMDLAGNNWETVIGVNNTTNTVTMTALGDGNLTSTPGPTDGDGNVTGWSNYSANTYWGIRGGAWLDATNWSTHSQTSNRFGVPSLSPTTPTHVGIRGVR